MGGMWKGQGVIDAHCILISLQTTDMPLMAENSMPVTELAEVGRTKENGKTENCRIIEEHS